MNKLLKHKADFSHKLVIKIYMCALTLLFVKLFPQITSVIEKTPWEWFAAILGISYLYCLKRVISD